MPYRDLLDPDALYQGASEITAPMDKLLANRTPPQWLQKAGEATYSFLDHPIDTIANAMKSDNPPSRVDHQSGYYVFVPNKQDGG